MPTLHSLVRAEERTRYRGDAAARFIENGVARGKTADQFRQNERRYLSGLSRDNCTAKAYNGYCLIVSPYGECITLYALPEWFGKKRFYDSKTKIRNVKKYAAS